MVATTSTKSFMVQGASDVTICRKVRVVGVHKKKAMCADTTLDQLQRANYI